MSTYNENMATFKDDLSEVRYPLRKRMASELVIEQAERKAKRDDMLEAIPESHPQYDELVKIVNEEYKVAMLEISSGNGSADSVTKWDNDKHEFSSHLSAQAPDSNPRNASGISDDLIDNTHEHDGCMDSIINKNEVTYFDKETGEYITTTNSNYSIWDTIELNGMSIVRKSEQWKNGFRASKWQRYEATRAKKKHNALLGINNNVSRERVTDDAMERKQAKRLARLAKRAGNVNKVGYNAFQ